MRKKPMTAHAWFDRDPVLFVEEHNYGPDDPFYAECTDRPGFCCCSVCQGLSGPAGADYIDMEWDAV